MAEETQTQSGGGKLARRALLATAGVGACAAAAAATPWVLSKANEAGQNAAEAALQQGIAKGRAELAMELEKIEIGGVDFTIDLALTIAGTAQTLVNAIVVPVAKLVAAIGTGALDTIYNALGTAISTLSNFGQHVQWMSDLQTMVGAWRTNLNNSTTVLSSVLNTDFSATETYLTAVKTKLDKEIAAATATTPTAKPGY